MLSRGRRVERAFQREPPRLREGETKKVGYRQLEFRSDPKREERTQDRLNEERRKGERDEAGRQPLITFDLVSCFRNSPRRTERTEATVEIKSAFLNQGVVARRSDKKKKKNKLALEVGFARRETHQIRQSALPVAKPASKHRPHVIDDHRTLSSRSSTKSTSKRNGNSASHSPPHISPLPRSFQNPEAHKFIRKSALTRILNLSLNDRL